MKRLAGMATLVALLLPAYSYGRDLGIDGTTIIRVEQRNTPGFSDKTVIPATQYLGLDARDIGVKGLSLHFFGWGRIDLADDSSESTDPSSTDGDFTYGYLMYRLPHANAQVKAGRFFVYEGVAADQIDGIYARTDLNYGFTIAAFGGVPVKLDHRSSSSKGDSIFGGRLGYRYGGMLDIGISGLNEADALAPVNGPNAKDDRKLVGGDIWFSPYRMIELAGRSSYNSTTEEIAEHSYNLTIRPLAVFTAVASYTDIRLDDFFAFTNTPEKTSPTQRQLFDPTTGDKFKSYGLSATYRLTNAPFPTEISAEWKHYDRDSIGDSERYGGGIRIKPDEAVTAGISFSAVDAADGIMSYTDVRGYALYEKKWFRGSIDIAADFYDDDIYDKKQGIEATASVGYQFNPGLVLSGDISYSDNPWVDSDVRGLVRLTFSYTNANVKGVPQ